MLIGGEPTMHKKFIEVIKFFRSKGILVTCTTNVLHLNKGLLKKMRDSGLNILNLSIYRANSRGQRYNLDKIQSALCAANNGAFDTNRIVLS